MLRRSLFIALLAACGIAANAAADPILVDFHWADPSGTLAEAYDVGDDALSPKEPGSKSRGRSEWAHAKNEARKLYFWISRDGIEWRRADLEITSWSDTGARGRVKHGDTAAWGALLGAYGWGNAGTGNILEGGFVGLSSSAESWNGEFSARIVSMHLTIVPTPIGSVPEPGTLAIFGVGLVALGVARRFRRGA